MTFAGLGQAIGRGGATRGTLLQAKLGFVDQQGEWMSRRQATAPDRREEIDPTAARRVEP